MSRYRFTCPDHPLALHPPTRTAPGYELPFETDEGLEVVIRFGPLTLAKLRELLREETADGGGSLNVVA